MNKNFNDLLTGHGDYLYRFALARLRDTHLAEDAVQETMLAAIKSESYDAASSVRTWLTGILKYKIIDLQRKLIREQPISNLIDLETTNSTMDDFFDQQGHWVDKPQEWEMPDNILEQKQLSLVISKCINNLPKKLASIFTLRDINEIDNEDICKEMGITMTNAWVMLYRARMLLRKCLELNWTAG